MIVVLSDHGEEFGEHGGTGHGKTLYEEQLRVPLLVKLPGNRNAGEVRDSIVEIVDVAPTILDEVALPADARFQGTSLLRAIREGDSRWEGRIGYASLFLDERSMRAAKSAHLKYVHDLVGESEQWFDLKSDPRERTPLPAAPAAGEVLRNHARRVGAFGASGFHLLLTHDSTRDIVVTGTITGAADARAEIRYPADRVRIERDDEVIRFEVRMPLVENREQASARWREVFELESETVVGLLRMGAPQTEQDHAEIIVDVPPDAALQVQLYVDDNPVDPASVRSGASGTPLALDGTAIRMPDTIAPADAYDPAALPQSTAVYVWYIPSAETLADDQLDPGIRESLEALGYIE